MMADPRPDLDAFIDCCLECCQTITTFTGRHRFKIYMSYVFFELSASMLLLYFCRDVVCNKPIYTWIFLHGLRFGFTVPFSTNFQYDLGYEDCWLFQYLNREDHRDLFKIFKVFWLFAGISWIMDAGCPAPLGMLLSFYGYLLWIIYLLCLSGFFCVPRNVASDAEIDTLPTYIFQEYMEKKGNAEFSIDLEQDTVETDEVNDFDNIQIQVPTRTQSQDSSNQIQENNNRHSSRSENRNTPVSAEQESCVICFEDYTNDDIIRLLPCYHFFHQECVDTWLRLNSTCPFCRNPIRRRRRRD